MKNKLVKRILIFCVIFILTIVPITQGYAINNEIYYLGGMPIGFSIDTKGVIIVGFSNIPTKNGNLSPAKEQFELGDIIYQINEIEINNLYDIDYVLKDYFVGDELIIQGERRNKKFIINYIPTKDVNGKYRLGLYVRNNISGIGTTTYIKEDNGYYYGSLGHPVLNEDGTLTKITGGNIYNCAISNVLKSKKGIPGELQGIFIKDYPIGNVEKNTQVGVFGQFTNFCKDAFTQIELSNKVTIGKAKIYTTIDGSTPKYYSINIVKYDKDNVQNKNFVIKITDEDLLAETGGIVQGMSGSPIIQNGKLIGAVTHVFINDPTRGFGILIDNMINE